MNIFEAEALLFAAPLGPGFVLLDPHHEFDNQSSRPVKSAGLSATFISNGAVKSGNSPSVFYLRTTAASVAKISMLRSLQPMFFRFCEDENSVCRGNAQGPMASPPED